MEVTPTNQVSLKYPRNENEGSSDFMYSGTMKQFPKEYFLVIDHVTGEVTLEKLTANIQLKRTKYELLLTSSIAIICFNLYLFYL